MSFWGKSIMYAFPMPWPASAQFIARVFEIFSVPFDSWMWPKMWIDGFFADMNRRYSMWPAWGVDHAWSRMP